MGNKKVEEKKTGKIAKVVIIASAVIITSLLLMLYFAYPQMSARSRMAKIYGIIAEGRYDYIVLTHTKPFTSGSVEQMTQDFELRLDGEDRDSFISAFTSVCGALSPDGYSTQIGGFWDMRVTVVSGDERHVFYVYEGGVYVTEKYRRFNFKVEGDSLYDTVEEIKNAQYE